MFFYVSFHLALHSLGPSMLQSVRLPYFLWVSNIPLCVCTTAFSSACLLMDTGLLPYLGYCTQCCNEHRGALFCQISVLGLS